LTLRAAARRISEQSLEGVVAMSPIAVRAVAVAGLFMALLQGVHSVAFHAVPGFEDQNRSAVPTATFPAEAPLHFFAWILSAGCAWVIVAALVPAIWIALGRGRWASVVALLVFAGAIMILPGLGAALNYYPLSVAYSAADEASRVGLTKAFEATRGTVQAVLGAGLPVLFLGALGMAVASAVGRGPGPRWYGGLYLVALFLDVPLPVGPPILWGLLNATAWGAFAVVTVTALRQVSESTVTAESRA
jgi:hypothetical protein